MEARGRNRSIWRLAAATSLALLAASGASAQTGAVRGTVVDDQGQPVEKAEVLIEFLGGVSRQLTTTSSAKGDFIQVGLSPGNYRLTFEKQGYETVTQEVRVRLGEPTSLGKVVLPKVPEGQLSREEAAKLGAEVQRQFDAGVEAAKSGNHQAAIEAFKKVIELVPDSAESYYNLGFACDQSGDKAQALAHYQKAVELRPDYYEAYLALSNLYNEKRQWPEAMSALGKAVELRPTEVVSLYNYGAVAMNAGDMAAAQKAFEKLVEVDPNHAAAHFQLGMVSVNQAKNDEAIEHLEKYLGLEPEGPHAATAKGILQYLKKD